MPCEHVREWKGEAIDEFWKRYFSKHITQMEGVSLKKLWTIIHHTSQSKRAVSVHQPVKLNHIIIFNISCHQHVSRSMRAYLKIDVSSARASVEPVSFAKPHPPPQLSFYNQSMAAVEIDQNKTNFNKALPLIKLMKCSLFWSTVWKLRRHFQFHEAL